MKIALFAAVPEEVGTLADKVNFTGIGKENATRTMVRFMKKYENEDFVIINMGTVGSHDREVGSILSISEIISAAAMFNEHRMLLDVLPVQDAEVQQGILYSSDCFVSPEVFTADYLDGIKRKVDCFDMESSALYTVAHEFGKKYVSYKIVSDNLDVTIEIWKQRVVELSKKLVAHIQEVIDKLGQKEPIEFLKLED